MSTFGGLTTAYSGLAAARAALETTGQNVANVGTAGYTRQRVEQQSIGGIGNSALFTNGLNVGQGVQITGISRLNDSLVDARVRDTGATNGYWTAASSALSTVETGLAEPGDTGLSKSLSDFWNAWSAMGNAAGPAQTSAGAASALLTAAGGLTQRLAAGYDDAAKGWSAGRDAAQVSASTVNDAARQIAALNRQILGVKATNGNANELMDQRSTAIANLAALTGASTRPNSNGTVDVLLGGATLVSGTDVMHSVQLAAPLTMQDLGTRPVQLEFTDRPGVAVQVDGGTLAAQLNTLAPANSTASGGIYAETGAAYDAIATALVDKVNPAHHDGVTPGGDPGGDFFGAKSSGPAALGLSVIPKDAAGIASASKGKGNADNSNADAIGQLGGKDGSPDATWSAFVTRIGSQAKAATTQANISASAASAAATAQNSQSGVDLDEETANLVVFQHAYQGAARAMTAIDEMLDTLINKTGLVGR